MLETAHGLKSASRTTQLSKAERKRQKILEAAAKLFAARGYAQTTLADIAEAAGTQAGSLYYHFESRDHIVREILAKMVTTTVEHVTQAIEALPPTATPMDKIRVGIIAHLNSALLRDDYFKASSRIFHEVSRELRQEGDNKSRAYARYWDNLLAQAQQAGQIRKDIDLHILRLTMFGSLVWSSRWFDPKGRMTPTQIAEEMLKVFIDGARKR